MGIVGFFVCLFLNPGFVLENLPVALNHKTVCAESAFRLIPSYSLLSYSLHTFSAQLSEAKPLGPQCFQGALTKPPYPAAMPVLGLSQQTLKIPPAPTKPIQAILYMNSKHSPNNAAMVTICSLSTNSRVFTQWFGLRAKPNLRTHAVL